MQQMTGLVDESPERLHSVALSCGQNRRKTEWNLEDQPVKCSLVLGGDLILIGRLPHDIQQSSRLPAAPTQALVQSIPQRSHRLHSHLAGFHFFIATVKKTT